MANIYYDDDANLQLLSGKKIAILGYGSQGHAHALNAQESGLDVVVGLREGSSSWTEAEQAGLRVAPVREAAAEGDVVMVLLPDEVQGTVYREEIAPGLQAGDTLAFAHGFNVQFHQVVPPEGVDVIMVAPKGPGHLVRRAYAEAIGGTRGGALETTFQEETETDLFGEQAVLCGGVTELMQAGFDTLVQAGYQPEIAYFECVHEMKLIVDLIYEGGFEKMRHSVSNTAEYGDYRTGKRMVTEETRAEMRRVLSEIQTGRFAHEFLLENQVGQPRLKTERAASDRSQVAEVGRRLRKMMSFIEQ